MIVLRQSKIDNTNASVSFASTPVPGNLIIVACTRSTGTAYQQGDVTDNQSNTYTFIRNQSGNGGTDQGALFYAKGVAASGTFTVTYPGLGTVSIYEYSGAHPVSPLDQQNSGSGSSTTPSSGNVTTARNGELYFGLAWSITNGDSWTAGSTYTKLQAETDNSTFERHCTEHKIVNALTGAATWTVPTSSAWLALIATFKPNDPSFKPNILRPRPFAPGIAR